MKALNKIKTLFSKKKHPQQSFIYAITAGRLLGELLVYTETENTEYKFLSLPRMTITTIPADKFKTGMEDGIVEIVEKLPAYVYKTCIQQYNKTKSKVLALEDIED
jgi:hypothetical protein